MLRSRKRSQNTEENIQWNAFSGSFSHNSNETLKSLLTTHRGSVCSHRVIYCCLLVSLKLRTDSLHIAISNLHIATYWRFSNDGKTFSNKEKHDTRFHNWSCQDLVKLSKAEWFRKSEPFVHRVRWSNWPSSMLESWFLNNLSITTHATIKFQLSVVFFLARETFQSRLETTEEKTWTHLRQNQRFQEI